MTMLVNHQAASQAYYGVAEQIITPPLAIYARNWGAAAFDQAQALHRPMMMQGLVTCNEDGQLLQVMLTADLGWWKNSQDELSLRTRLLETFGLESSQLLFCLSHTHAGPSICSKDADKPGGEFIAPYLDFLFETAKAIIYKAQDNRMEACLVWTYGRCDLATKRDLQINEEFLIGYDPFAAADDTLVVGLLRSREGIALAVIVNYACHPTTFAHENTLLSPDFIGAMREVIQDAWAVPSLFLQGASGDLAPMEQYVADPRIVDSHGRKLGYAALAAMEGLRDAGRDLAFSGALASGAPLALWKEQATPVAEHLFTGDFTVDVPYKQLPSVALIEQEHAVATDRVLKDRLWRKLNTRLVIGDQKEAKLPLWIWQMGEAILVAQPNETYSDFQLELRKAFPNTIIMVVNIANGYVGYLPPAALYENDMYAVWQTPFAAGALEKLTETSIALIAKHCTYETRTY